MKKQIKSLLLNIKTKSFLFLLNTNDPFKIKNILYVIAFLSIITHLNSQQIWPNFSFPPTNINPGQFSSGINAACNSTLAPGSNDLTWHLGGQYGPPAVVINRAASSLTNCSWAPNGPAGTSMWIGQTSASCPPSTDLTDISCITGYSDFYYVCNINLPVYSTNPLFAINWGIFASGWVQDIKLGSTTIWDSYYVTGAPPYHANVGINLRWCKWSPGSNVITIHVRNKSGYGCGHTGLQVITYAPIWGYPNITSTPIVCPNTSFCFSVPNATAMGITPAYNTSFSWTKPAGWPASNSTATYCGTSAGINSGIVAVQAYSISGAGTHTNYVCLTTSAYSITVAPSISITPSAPSICKGNNVTLSASGLAPSTVYTWYVISGSAVLLGTGSSIVVAPLSTSTYSVKAISSFGCVTSKTVVVTVKPVPNVSISTSSNPICNGQTASLLASGNTQTGYTWTPGNSHVNPLSVSPNVNTTYFVTGQLTNGCTNTAVMSITVLPTPNLVAFATPSVICPGDPVVISASGANNYYTMPGSYFAVPFTAYPSTSTTYTVQGVGTNGCSSKVAVPVLVLTQPTVVCSPPQICAGISNTLTATGAINYKWILGTVPVTIITGTNSIIITPTANIAYTVCGTAGNICQGCTNGTLTMGSLIPLTASDVTLCTNGGPCANISANTTATGSINYHWSPGALTTTSSAGGSTVNVCPTANTVYQVNASSTNNGCPSSATMQVVLQSSCCSQPTTGLALLPTSSGLGGLYQNNSYYLNSSITLTANTNFVNSEVWILPGVSITVPAGKTLDLDRTHLYACGINMWQGIVVQDGGRITTQPLNTRLGNSLIEDALVAIDLDNISLANSNPNPPIDIQRIIFNRNLIGIKISNSVPGLDSLALGINGCVFSSRSMTFAQYPLTLSWPSSEMNCTLGGLRCPTSPTTGLVPPYTFGPNPQMNLKQPYNNQPGHIGIKIENIGDPNELFPKPGVQIGITYPGPITNDFNLFDGLGVGVEITDASFTAKNNVFQNMLYYGTTLSSTGFYGGQGIKHAITNLKNARLYLTGVNNNDDGNRFWDCNTGVFASNVRDCWVKYAIIRSTHIATNYPLPTATVGDTGISNYTNRFDFSVKESQFSNLKYGVVLNTVPGSYMVAPGSPPNIGTCLTGVEIERNYFGPEPKSLTPYSGPGISNNTEYMGTAIQLSTPNTAGWSYDQYRTAFYGYVSSNKIDRTFRGIDINGMADATLAVSGNLINIEDDFTTNWPGTAQGFGISVQNNFDNLAVQYNTLTAQPWYVIAPPLNPTVALIYCSNNIGTQSPRIECNSVTGSYYGFQFDGPSPNTVWEGNYMCDNWSGMALTAGGVIGIQGSPGAGSGNIWSTTCSPWNTAQAFFQTYCENSDPTQSFLYVKSNSQNEPFFNGTNWFFPPYMPSPSPSLDNSCPGNRLMDCLGNGAYLPPPTLRMNNGSLQTSLNSFDSNMAEINVYPNPTNGKLTIDMPIQTESLELRIIDLTGKVVYCNFNIHAPENSIDLSALPSSIYLLEIKTNTGKTVRKKLIKTD